MVFRLSAQRLAQIGICAQFLALIRTLAEYLRLRYVYGSSLTLVMVGPFVTGALLAAVCTWFAVVCYFAGKHRLATGVAGGTVVLLVVYKVVAIG